MRVQKRNGDYEEVSFDKVLNRIRNLSNDLAVDIFDVSQKVCGRIYDNVKTSELDELAAHICSSMILDHPDYGVLASRIIISNHQKNTSPSFSETIQILYDNVDGAGVKNPLISEELYQVVARNKEKLNNYIDYNRDYKFDYFGFKTLERSYLMRVNGRIIERPQHMFMRVALGIHGNDVKDALQTYDLMSQKYFTHATPTLFNAGTPRPQCSSCFLVSSNGDAIDSIFQTIQECALISKYSGGIGIHISDIRSRGSRIRGTNGTSTGIVPMLRVYNNTARYVNQCFTPDTIVFSREGPKCMENITCTDYLVTIDGSFKKVNSIAKNHVNKEILNIQIKYAFGNTRVTPEHEVYVIQGQTKMLNFDVIKKRLKSGYAAPKFIEAKHICEDDFVGFPVPTYEEDINISNDALRFYGIMVGDGHISERKNCNSVEYGITLNQTSKYHVVQFCEKYLQNSNIHFWTTVDDMKNTYTIKWSDRCIGISYDELYDKNKNKIIKEDFLHLPKDKLLALVKGLLETDGSYGNELYFHNTSLPVVMSLRYILIRLGILTSGHIEKSRDGSRSFIQSQKPCYVVRIPKSDMFKCIFPNDYVPSNKLGYFEYNNILWSRVRKITKEDYQGMVYDFNMTDNHNYTVANMGLVHNSGKRNGSIAVYLEPWHADVESFLDLRKNHGNEEDRTRDLFLALWIPDLFMERVKNGGVWSLMCPDQCKGLNECYGAEFVALYEKYERDGQFIKQVNAQDIWFKILESQIETGTPYLLYKDSANRKSNQRNLGTIKSSNLCSEIIEYSSPDECAVCNLASICLPTYVDPQTRTYNYEKLHEIAKVITKNLNKVIDLNFYPIEKGRVSNLRHRPIGIGVQGLADTFALMKIAFDSDEAAKVNKEIFETIYHGALEASLEIAKKRHEYAQELCRGGVSSDRQSELNSYLRFNEFDPTYDSEYPGAYVSFKGSPASQGHLQFDLWGVQQDDARYDWTGLKNDIMKYGLRNSLFLAPMPTASTSQIMGFNESFEAFTSNMYKRKTLAGEFIILNKYLLDDLIGAGIWNKNLRDKLMLSDGSIQDIDEIPQVIKDLYKTAWELKQKVIIDHAADRGIYVCQSQSMNLYIEDPDYKKLTSMHFYAWSKGLKTGVYYLRTKARAQTQKFTVDPSVAAKKKEVVCNAEDGVCLVCSS